ncbi:zinc finger, CCHC-type containing protein [Tanacetum coccineum]
MIGERMYYPWLHYEDYDRYYISTCDDARCSFHDIYVEVVVTSRHLSYPRSILTPRVPHLLYGDYTPKLQEEIDDSLYVYGKKGPQKPEISDSDDNSTEHSTCQSNDSEGSFGNPSEHSSESESESISVPNEMSTSKSVTTNEKVMSESKEVEPSCATHVKTPRQQMKNQGTPKVKGKNWNKMIERELGEGYSFIKKKCFVCGSLSHLIKDCDFYEKKMAREAELKKQRVFNTGQMLILFSLRDQASNWLERLPVGSITTWEDLTTRFLAQFFPPGRTAKLRNDILMFQQHHGESLSEAWTCFKDLLQKVPHHVIDRWLQIQNFYDHDHEGWNDTKEFVKPVKAISTPQSTSKTLDRRLLELEDHNNFLLKGSRPTPKPSSTHIPQAYAEAVYSNPYLQNQNEPPKQNPFTFRECTGPNPQPQALGTTFEARVRDYMAAHTKRMEIFENAIFKQHEEINDRMTKMFENLKELTTSRAPEKVLIMEEAKFLVTKNHRINEKLIEGLMGNHWFNDSLSGARVRKIKGKTYNLSPRGPVYEAILRKKITRKEDIGGNFEIPCNIGGLKQMNALVDQGSDVNVMPLSTYMKLTDKRPAETDIKLSLASHSYIYPLRIAEDILVEVAEDVYPMDIVILDIKKDEKRPFILGTPFLTTAKAVIKFDKGTVNLRSEKSKISFHKIPESPCMIERGVKNDIEPIAPTMTLNRLVLEWEERIKLHLKREIEFNRWKRKNFKGMHPTLVIVEGGMDDEG